MLVTDKISGVDGGFLDNKQLIVGLIVHQVGELHHQATKDVYHYAPTMHDNVGFAAALSSGGVVTGFVNSMRQAVCYPLQSPFRPFCTRCGR